MRGKERDRRQNFQLEIKFLTFYRKDFHEKKTD